MSKPGLSIESAASVIARDMVTKHLEVFGPAIRAERAVSQSVVSAYIDGLAGAVALTITGGHGARNDVIEATIIKLREAIARDLMHLQRIRGLS